MATFVIAQRMRMRIHYMVVRVNRDPANIYVAETLEAALDLANPDSQDLVECGRVEAPDAGASMSLEPEAWIVW